MDHDSVGDSLWQRPLVLAATPIGNLGDTSGRLKSLLTTAEIIACEDTRRTRHLIQALGLSTDGRTGPRLVSMHEHNEASRAAELVEAAAAGTRVLVVSDAGMPAVSDPGFRLIRAAVDAGIEPTVAPGASAVTTALALSALPTDRFGFGGFVPRKASERARLLDRLAGEEWTTVLFESPHRITATLSAFAEALGEGRPAAVARELTKRYEEVLRGTLGELAARLAARQEDAPLRGEFVLVLGGAENGRFTPGGTGEPLSTAELAGVVLERAAAGQKLKAAAKQVAAEHGVTASELYDAANALRRG